MNNNNNNIKEYGTFEFENRYCVKCSKCKAIDLNHSQCMIVGFLLSPKPFRKFVDVIALYTQNAKAYPSISELFKRCKHFKQLELLSKLRNI